MRLSGWKGAGEMKTLAITASIVGLVLVLGLAVLALFPDADSGEPVAIFDIERATSPESGQAPGQAETANTIQTSETAPPGNAAAPGDVGVPPGFAVTLPPPNIPQGQQTPQGQQQSAPSPQQQSAPTPQQGAPAAETGSPGASLPPQGLDGQTGPITLGPVPVAELVEESQYGPLPKIAADGRRPLDVYARPSRAPATVGAGGPARVALLVGGMGVPNTETNEVIKALPAPVSVAYGAYGRGLQDWVMKAREAGHEILLELPLEPENYPQNDPGPHTLLTTLPPEENMKRLQWLMSRFTGYVGVTNHMGEKFQSTQESFQPVLEEIKERGLLYLDDGAAEGSTAGQIAGVLGLDYAVANIQIDAASPGGIAKALDRLEALAKERGTAIGVATATPATVKKLAAWAEQLQSKGIELVPVSAAVRAQRQS
jgi:polysaccharide deacetylase 2 family uncharacterized protein YibQ